MPHHCSFSSAARHASLLLILAGLLPSPMKAASPAAAQKLVEARVQQEYGSLDKLYKELHAAPELSQQEVKTSARVAEELRKAGFEVASGIGGHGVVGVLRNGKGPAVLVRADMDGLPVKEQTGLPYASKVVSKDSQGNDVPVMHACGHDVHMTCLIGTARVLAQLKDHWRGTLVCIGQPAEEAGAGARAMLQDGLFERFPRPDYCLALHDNDELPAGTVGYVPGYMSANVDSADILVRGVGGHGAHPNKAKDPVVLAAQIVVALQTIASREVKPGEPVVITVGTIHGGTRRNIIPDEVRLGLTIRTYGEEVRQQALSAIKRIARGEALAAGMPEDRLPEVKLGEDPTPALFNQPELTERLARVWKDWLGETQVVPRKPGMGGEDFSEYGLTKEKVPICMFSLGAVDLQCVQASKQSGRPLPAIHSPLFAPAPEPTIKTGVTAMTAAVLELIGKP